MGIGLGAEEVRLTKKNYGWPEDAQFLVPEGVLEHFKDGIGKRGHDLVAGNREQLLQHVWGPQYGSESAYLRVYLAALRRKLEPNPSQPRYFLTEPGMGYRFEPGEEQPAPA